jgi:hypothetical protein
MKEESMSKVKVQAIRIRLEADESPDLSFLEDEGRYAGVPPAEAAKYHQQDQERLASYGDSWNMIGIWAEADVVIGGVVQKIQSGGLWGIESDSARTYLVEVAKGEYYQLHKILKSMGATRITPFKDVEGI